mgnify:CR=1 FL=1
MENSFPGETATGRKLLVLAPYFEVFIKGRMAGVSSYFSHVTVLTPSARFGRSLLRIPYFNLKFDFLRPRENICTGHKFSVFTPRFFTLPIDPIRKRNGYLILGSCIRTILRNEIDFDIIHGHFLYPLGFVGARLKSLFDKPFVITAHGGDIYSMPFKDEYYLKMVKYVLRQAHCVITTSHSNSKILQSLGASSKRLSVIPNGYDPDLFKLIPIAEARRKLGLPLNKKILVSVGNLNQVKGHIYLIEAMHLISKKRKDVILIIVGSGPMEKELRRKILSHSLEKNVFLVGRKMHHEIPLWMNAATLFVLPSLAEGFPTVIPEAMACGKPVIGTRVGGVPEAMASDDVGVLVNPKDPEALAQAILEALDKKWRPQIISNYAKQYSWSNLVKQILEVYRQVLFEAQ